MPGRLGQRDAPGGQPGQDQGHCRDADQSRRPAATARAAARGPAAARSRPGPALRVRGAHAGRAGTSPGPPPTFRAVRRQLASKHTPVVVPRVSRHVSPAPDGGIGTIRGIAHYGVVTGPFRKPGRRAQASSAGCLNEGNWPATAGGSARDPGNRSDRTGRLPAAGGAGRYQRRRHRDGAGARQGRRSAWPGQVRRGQPRRPAARRGAADVRPGLPAQPGHPGAGRAGDPVHRRAARRRATGRTSSRWPWTVSRTRASRCASCAATGRSPRTWKRPGCPVSYLAPSIYLETLLAAAERVRRAGHAVHARPGPAGPPTWRPATWPTWPRGCSPARVTRSARTC